MIGHHASYHGHGRDPSGEPPPSRNQTPDLPQFLPSHVVQQVDVHLPWPSLVRVPPAAPQPPIPTWSDNWTGHQKGHHPEERHHDDHKKHHHAPLNHIYSKTLVISHIRQ
ncbi:hypothetical protein IHE45_05G066700 [Dioscorea alata]|uniref:Uncharacterized protein n=1 Tax=Dioscorea alata TaxID=55571 RepID=A0ACB7W1U4_DIOAL|nr:hypothetical protein IHE45_05G066700 [Dioscorea alata]